MAKGKKGGKKGKKHGRRKKKVPVIFPIASVREILNPFGDANRAKRARQRIYRLLVKNRDTLVRTGEDDTLVPRPVPAVADTDEYLVDVHNHVFHAENFKPAVGEENDKGKHMPGRDGGRLNTLSVKELHKMLISLNNSKKQAVLSCSLVTTERKQMMNQLHLVEEQLKAKKQQNHGLQKERAIVDQDIAHTVRVYKEKLKHTMSENHENVFAAKTAHLETYGQRFKEYWRREMEQRERLARDKEDSEYNRIMLQRIGKEIELDVRGRRQVAKEDYLMATQTQLENFDVYVSDTQNNVSDQVKAFVRDLELLKRKHNDEMLADQDKAIGQLRKFFQGVNVANSSIIHQLKNEVNTRRLRLDRIERDVLKALEENAKYLIPLQQMNSDVVMYEDIVKQAPAVQAAHQRLWARSKHLEEQVLRLTWNKELAVYRLHKAKTELKELQASYTDATFDIARKASLAQVLYHQQQMVMEEELAMYAISQFLLQAYSTAANPNFNQSAPSARSSISRQTMIRDFLERQEEEIVQLRIQGLLIKRKYEFNREKMDNIFKKKYMHGLSGVGLEIAPLETYLDNDMIYFHGVSEEKLRDMEQQPAIARWSSTIAHAGPSGDHALII